MRRKYIRLLHNEYLLNFLQKNPPKVYAYLMFNSQKLVLKNPHLRYKTFMEGQEAVESKTHYRHPRSSVTHEYIFTVCSHIILLHITDKILLTH